jgi:hypothetical protein
MYETDFPEEQKHDEYHSKYGEWIECAKCRALMFDTFKSCWSCGIAFTEKNKNAVRI